MSAHILLNLLNELGKSGFPSILSLFRSKFNKFNNPGARWGLSSRVLDSRPRGRGFEPHWRHCVVSLSKTHLS